MNMEYPKFEFYKITIVSPSDKVLSKSNKKFDSGENFTVEESIWFWRPTHDIEVLNFAGENGWEIRAVTSKETNEGIEDTYFLQRNNMHPNFGKLTFNEEYHESALYKEHERLRAELRNRKK
ncbi:hypothetical protein HGA91_05905 [candidate division WWE3 bacterium]|nr:hypothetical protein [candidate division WWE3 bacterium]